MLEFSNSGIFILTRIMYQDFKFYFKTMLTNTRKLSINNFLAKKSNKQMIQFIVYYHILKIHKETNSFIHKYYRHIYNSSSPYTQSNCKTNFILPHN